MYIFKKGMNLCFIFLNSNIFLALLFRITCLGVLNSISETQLKTVDSWREVDTLEIRNIWYAFLTLLEKESIFFFSHVPLHPRIATGGTLEKHVFLELCWSTVQGRRGLQLFALYRKLWIYGSNLPFLFRDQGASSGL